MLIWCMFQVFMSHLNQYSSQPQSISNLIPLGSQYGYTLASYVVYQGTNSNTGNTTP